MTPSRGQHHPPHPPETRQRAEHLHKQGFTAKQISQQLGIPYLTVYRWLNPAYRAKAAATSKRYKERHKRQCEDCGATIWMTSRYCADCAAKRNRTWTEETVIQAIHRFNQRHGRPPLAQEWTRGAPDHPNPGTAINLFGSWANAIEAAGYPRPHVGHKTIDHSAERNRAKQLQADGHTVEQIADIFRLPPSVIRRYLASTDRVNRPANNHRPRKLGKRTREQRIADLQTALAKEHNQ